MEKLPKIGLPILFGIVILIIIISKSAVTIGSGQAGVLYKTFGNGVVPEFHVLDAQISLKVPSFKSTIKVGGTNLTGKEYFTAFGTGNIGSMYYVSWTINNL